MLPTPTIWRLSSQCIIRDREPIAAVALTTDTSALTAIGNDLGFQLFARQLLVLGKSGDVAIGISTSGRSVNVVRALQVARSGIYWERRGI